MSHKLLSSVIFVGSILTVGLDNWFAGGPFGFLMITPADAIIGMPATPLSVAGAARRTARRTVAVESAAVATTAAAASAAAASAAAANAAAAATVVVALPGACTTVPVAGGTYFNCSGVFYRPYYQGGNLVYAVVPPPY